MNEKLNIAPFVKGDKVIAIRDSLTPGFFKKGDVFIITSTIKCCIWLVDIGFSVSCRVVCQYCGHKHVRGIQYAESRAFRKVQESKFRAVSFEKVMEETEIICEN